MNRRPLFEKKKIVELKGKKLYRLNAKYKQSGLLINYTGYSNETRIDRKIYSNLSLLHFIEAQVV